MRKTTKEELKALARTMRVIPEWELDRYIGGLDPRDCWWRCIAYVSTNGDSYCEYIAMQYAEVYYGENFDSENYAFTGNPTSLLMFINIPANYEAILYYHAKGSSVSYGHAVVVLETDPNGFNGFRVFDPQAGVERLISRDEIDPLKACYCLGLKS